MKSHPAPVLDAQEPVSKAFDALSKSPAVIIMKEGQFAGIIDDRNARFGLGDVSKTKCETIVIRTPVLMENSSVLEACQSFLAGHFKALPVQKGRVSEISTRTDLIEKLLQERTVPKKGVKEVMNTPVYSIDQKQSLAEARNQMREKGTRKLIATRNGVPFGIISTYDLVGIGNPSKGKRDTIRDDAANIEKLAISEFVREGVNSIEVTKSLEDAAQLMVKARVSSLLVTDGGVPKGIISATDIFKQMITLSNKKPPFPISGLDASEKEMYETEIRDEIEPVLEKYGKSLFVTHLSLHVKKNKSVFQGKLFFELDNRPHSVESEAHTHHEMAAQIAHELQVILSKQKDKKANKQIHSEEE